jgi:hypothetical protein
MAATLYDQLSALDETIAELENQRTDIINRMDATKIVSGTSMKVLQFPNAGKVVVHAYGRESRHIW